MAKISREKFKVWGNVFDEFTLRNLFKLEGKYFEELESPIAIGKEGNVFTAKARCEDKSPKKVIIKIYRLESCDFNRMYDYIRVDSRYIGLKNRKREIVFAWAQREFRNLMKAREIGVRVPTPLHCMCNILVLEMIGTDTPAPKLKDAIPENKEKFFKQVVEGMRKLHQNGMVHGDLSEFNILNDNERPVFIDFSQSTQLKTPNSDELVERDIRNICRFFKKKGVKCDEQTMREDIEKK
ncbi:serine protein kinase RIO [Candidatus Woesearchaeota archaeon]|nr:serine protein kinase RIO [Candidatus Woesearchaeota archaeon]MBT7367233.1 serine protein kinase RIO [Candidatus Woesearchaeota archaeon]